MATPTNDSYQAEVGQTLRIGLAGDLLALVESSLPVVTFTQESTTTDGQIPLDLGDGTGERDEIGLFTEWQSEWLAIRNDPTKTDRAETVRQFIISQADYIKDYPWPDKDSLSQVPHPTGNVSRNYSHFPNAFFLPIILTTDDTQRQAFIDAAKGKLTSSYDFEGDLPFTQNFMTSLQTRSTAWGLRELAQLAWLEVNGLIPGNDYRACLEIWRQALLGQSQEPINGRFHILGDEIWRVQGGGNPANVNWQFSCWQQSFMAMAIAWTIKLGFTEWQTVANFHVQHWIKKRDNWNWWMYDGSYSLTEAVYFAHDALPTQQEKDAYDWWNEISLPDRVTGGSPTTAISDALQGIGGGTPWDPNLLPDTQVNGQNITVNIRFDQQLTAVASYANIGISEASTLLTQMLSQRQARLDRGGAIDVGAMRYSLYWR